MKIMNDTHRWEDREHDWLAQEMAREGYRNNRSSLEKDHAVEEMSRGWNAGAVSNAKEHEERHGRITAMKQAPKPTPKPTASFQAQQSRALITIIFLMFFLPIFLGIFIFVIRTIIGGF